jgi:hypothetical protein
MSRDDDVQLGDLLEEGREGLRPPHGITTRAVHRWAGLFHHVPDDPRVAGLGYIDPEQLALSKKGLEESLDKLVAI